MTTKPQTWLGIQQLQKKPKQARREQQPLAELPLPRSARPAQQAQRAPHTAHHSDDTVEDKRGAAPVHQTVLVQHQLQTSVMVWADAQILQPPAAPEKMPHQQLSDLSRGAAALTSAKAAAGSHAKHLVAGKPDVVPCTPVAAAAHVTHPLSQRTCAKAAQALQSDAAANAADKVVEGSATMLAGGSSAQKASLQAEQAEQQWVQAGQPKQQGTADEGSPQQKASSDIDEYDFDAALQQTDEQAAEATKGRRMSLPLPQDHAARSTADQQVLAKSHTEARLLCSTSAAAAAPAAAVQGELPVQPGSPGVFGLSPPPLRTLHWRGHKPSAAAELLPARPADSGCPSGLALDPSAAFVDLEGLVQAVQGDQRQCVHRETEPENQGAAAPAVPDAEERNVSGMVQFYAA